MLVVKKSEAIAIGIASSYRRLITVIAVFAEVVARLSLF